MKKGTKTAKGDMVLKTSKEYTSNLLPGYLCTTKLNAAGIPTKSAAIILVSAIRVLLNTNFGKAFIVNALK